MALLRNSFFFVFLIVLSGRVMAQVNICRCNTSQQVTVCYLSRDEYCYNDPGCNHSLDGSFMKNYLAAKLQNASNFSGAGISKCKMNLKKMTKLSSVQQINDEKCDIFFVGSFGIDTLKNFNKLNSDKTSVPARVLNYIRTWSLQCESNLAIVAQAEAAPWGYVVNDANVNPNTALADPAKFNIFSGPFGDLTQFLQGGSYQGVITKTPASGSLILAKDANNRPTVAFDVLTNDFILGDIGILCGNAGNLSLGSLINQNNSNDVLAANMFALGCSITTGNKFTDEEVFICQGDDYSLPNGDIVNKEQVVADSFKLANGCDSVHFYKVFFYDQESSVLYENLCEGDSVKYVFDNAVFNEANPAGIGMLKNRLGCDSMVTVNLIYNKNTLKDIIEYPCHNSGYKTSIGNKTFDEARPFGIAKLKNLKGCDSTVTVKLNFLHPDTSQVYFIKCKGDTIRFDNKDYKAGAIYSLTYKAVNPCDSIVLLTIDTFSSASYNFPKSVLIEQSTPFIFKNTVSDAVSDIEWEDADGLSCLDCLNPTFNASSFPATFTVHLKDINACAYDVKINALYKCSPTIANAFAPNSVSGNDEVSFSSPCPLSSFSVEIYDRWGNKVYHSKRAEDTWDGRYNGQLQLPGVYTYKISYIDLSGNSKVEYGNVTLIR